MEITKETSKQKTKSNFDATAAYYNESSDGKFASDIYGEVVNRVLAEMPGTLLDVGCGNGNILKILEEKSSIELFGLDLSANMIKEAKKRLGDSVELKIGDSEAMPWKENSFDMIICNASFHHYTEPEKVVSEMKRVLKDGGQVILGDPTMPGSFMRWLTNKALKWSDGGDYHLYGKKDITQLFESAGFEVYNWSKPNSRTFVISARVRK